MGDNEFEEDQEKLVVDAIRNAAKSKKLTLEKLEGIDLNDDHWRKVLKIPKKAGDMTNEQILAYLKTN